MPDLDEMIEQLRRLRARPEAAVRDWYRIQAQAGTRTAEVRIYDDIGWMGTSAKSFADELSAVDADEIRLHLNSPGGDAWDGIAIYNALRAHPAKVVVTVDALAASAASVIAMAGDTVRMNRGAQLMIHDAWGLVIGNASDMQDAASMFDKLSDSLAGIYAARAGGTVDDWRKAMGTETWYTAAEAVDSGLADEMVDESDDSQAKARWDLKAYAFAYAGRDAAPPPTIQPKPKAPATAGAPSYPVTAAEAARRIHAASIREGAGHVDPAKIREALGLKADASDDEVKTALASAGLVVNSTPPAAPKAEETPAPKTEVVHASGTRVVSESVWEETQEALRRQQEFIEKVQRDERDQVIAKAVEDGKFTPAQKEHFARLWDADPKGTRELIDSLTRNSALAVAAMGYDALGDDEFDREYASLFPPKARKGA